ncbi:FkbM family methyltransferase [Novosphingobium sp. NBM11]|uniref:FkbM family methyltransferase n=1 Tax=Novosphingobium sp. NBM11 TaxID=2596914 RepID=UPI0018920530|nr:FkbM family methyltransferase [Novosphingobium sp. NBM11]MBF5090891.1 FkbM family methyltransferase [Novosphingobium sp. NBM11]
MMNTTVSARANAAVEARSVLGEDFFGGWEPSDIGLFERYVQHSSPAPGKITDFLGIRTSSFLHPWAQHYDNVVLGQIPLPDDSLRAEAIEYYATLHSLELAAADTFKMAELGASYAPWTCLGAVLARRSGRTNTRFVAVEASSYLYELIPLHLAENAVDVASANVQLIKGAVGTQKGVLYFPKVRNPMENGGQAADANLTVDYLGREIEHEEVISHPLIDILGDDIWDLVLIDVQGVEYDVLSAGIDTLNRNVRAIFIGTHSRKIEGQLIDLLHAHGWILERERPTKFSYVRERPDAVGWTTRDGGQYWRNSMKL